jgi:uncharacterized small protein (DUF1192 family)
MIQIGQKVSTLRSGRDGIVHAIHGEQRPETVRSIGGVIAIGGGAEFDIVFSDGTESKRLPECILNGTQWEIRDEIAGPEEISQAFDFLRAETARKDAEAQQKSAEFHAAELALRADTQYANLQQNDVGSLITGSKLVAVNLRRQLKKAYPGVKFSVKTSYDSVGITWTDGPTKDKVREISGMYQSGSFDGMNDIYEYSRSPWTTVFGGSKYVSSTRKNSPEALTAAVAAVCKDFGWEPVEVKTWDDGSAWVNLGDTERDRILSEYLAGRYRVWKAAA